MKMKTRHVKIHEMLLKLHLISELRKFTDNMVSIQKSIFFLYTSNKQFKIEILKIPFIIPPNNIKYLDMNLTKDVQDPHKIQQNIAERI